MTIFKTLSDYYTHHFPAYRKQITILLLVFLFLFFPKQPANGAGICTNQDISPIMPGTGNISIDFTKDKFTVSFEIDPIFAEINKGVFFAIAGSTDNPGPPQKGNFVGDTKNLSYDDTTKKWTITEEVAIANAEKQFKDGSKYYLQLYRLTDNPGADFSDWGKITKPENLVKPVPGCLVEYVMGVPYSTPPPSPINDCNISFVNTDFSVKDPVIINVSVENEKKSWNIYDTKLKENVDYDIYYGGDVSLVTKPDNNFVYQKYPQTYSIEKDFNPTYFNGRLIGSPFTKNVNLGTFSVMSNTTYEVIFNVYKSICPQEKTGIKLNNSFGFCAGKDMLRDHTQEDPIADVSCRKRFVIGLNRTDGGKVEIGKQAELSWICDQWITDNKYKTACRNCMVRNDGSWYHIWTALGCLPTDPTGFLQQYVLTYGIGIAGGIAFLYFLYGCFVILTSGGNPEKVEQAKQMITSSLSGLILIIFSVLIFRIISIDVLNLPGFEKDPDQNKKYENYIQVEKNWWDNFKQTVGF